MRTEIAVGEALRSLSWAGDDLIDWIGGVRISLDGNVQPFGTGYSYRFDAAIGLGDVGIAFEMFGTKGRIVKWNGELPEAGYIPIGFDELREIDRSYYHASDYAYPACLIALPDKRVAIAHCPRRYDTLDLELLDGKPLTKRKKKSLDIFHSRIAASPDGKWLLVNGWVWQPWNVIAVYDVAKALAEPAHLGTVGLQLDLGKAFDGEVDAAVLSGDRVIASGGAESPALAVVELPSGKNLASLPVDTHLGTRIMAWGPDQIVALDGNPRVVSLGNGEILDVWHDLDAGPGIAQPSVATKQVAPPFVAIDPSQPRFAITRKGGITVVAR